MDCKYLTKNIQGAIEALYGYHVVSQGHYVCGISSKKRLSRKVSVKIIC